MGGKGGANRLTQQGQLKKNMAVAGTFPYLDKNISTRVVADVSLAGLRARC